MGLEEFLRYIHVDAFRQVVQIPPFKMRSGFSEIFRMSRSFSGYIHQERKATSVPIECLTTTLKLLEDSVAWLYSVRGISYRWGGSPRPLIVNGVALQFLAQSLAIDAKNFRRLRLVSTDVV